MKIISCLFFLLLIFSGCNQWPQKTPVYPNSPSEKQILANQSRQKAALKIQKATKMLPFGTAGQMLDEIKMLGLAFQYRDSVDIEKGRELLVSAIDILVDTVNEEPEIHPYLANDPFLPKNIEIRIFIQNPDRTKPDPGELTIVSFIDGVLAYQIDDPNNSFRLETIYTETYEEAVQKLKASNAS